MFMNRVSMPSANRWLAPAAASLLAGGLSKVLTSTWSSVGIPLLLAALAVALLFYAVQASQVRQIWLASCMGLAWTAVTALSCFLQSANTSGILFVLAILLFGAIVVWSLLNVRSPVETRADKLRATTISWQAMMTAGVVGAACGGLFLASGHLGPQSSFLVWLGYSLAVFRIGASGLLQFASFKWFCVALLNGCGLLFINLITAGGST
jgi:hypothetical protein